MKKIERLRIEAKESSEFRGHVMSNFKHVGYDSKAYSECILCNSIVIITKKPYYNECEITGETISIHCSGVK